MIETMFKPTTIDFVPQQDTVHFGASFIIKDTNSTKNIYIFVLCMAFRLTRLVE